MDDASAAERPGSPVLRAVLRGSLVPVVHVTFRPRFTGAEQFPPTGPVILASNHLSFFDSVLLPLATPRPVYFIGKSEYVNGSGVRGRLMARFFTATGMIPVDRTSTAAGVAALHAGRRVLEAGQVFCVYPEGTRSPDGRLYRGRTGIARLALMTGAPIVPVATVGTDRVQPPGARVPRPGRWGRVEVRFGAPLDFSRHAGADRDSRLLREITDQVMRAIQKLSGQEYVASYAPARSPA